MNRFDYTNLGGMPTDQDHLAKLNADYLDGFKAVARLVGDNTIITGVEITAGNISNGYVVYQGELLRFVGGVAAPFITIVETPTSLVFDDTTVHDVEFERYATCTTVTGAVAIANMVRLAELRNLWLPGDIKEKLVDAAYEAANFDSNGYGTGREAGWRILTKAYPDTAGKVFVTKDDSNIDYDTVGKIGGQKDFVVTEDNIQEFTISKPGSAGTSGVGNPVAGNQSNDATVDYRVGVPNPTAIDNRMPFYVILKLIKL